MPPPNNEVSAEANEQWSLQLFIAGQSRRSAIAHENLERICNEHLAGRYSLEVIDLQEDPDAAETHRIFAVPTVVRQEPVPQRKIIGDLSDREQVMAGLGIPNR